MSHTTQSKVGLNRRPAKSKPRRPKSRALRHDADPGSEILGLQRTSGNQAVNQLIREVTHGTRGTTLSPPKATDTPTSGKLIDPSIRSQMESRFGADFSDVRVHTDAAADKSAHELGANAYTKGNNIVFGSGKYKPETAEGKKRLAHELTHVIQQRRCSGRESEKNRLSSPHDASEREADTVARAVMRGQHAPSIIGAAVGIQRDDKKDDKIPLLDDFAKKFPDAAKLIREQASAMKLVKEAADAGAEFGGVSEDGPAYTVGSKVYVPKTRTDPVLAMKSFLFELNNAVRKPKFAVIDKEATKGSKGTLDAKTYAYKTVELEVEGMLRVGEIWFDVRKKMSKEKKPEKYDADFYFSDYEAVKNGKKTKDDLIKEVLKRKYTSGDLAGKTVEQKYMEDYKSLSGGK